MIGVKFELTGLREALSKLSGLPKKVQNQALRQGLAEGGRMLQRAMKASAPQSSPAKDPRLIPGLLKLSFATKAKTYRNSGISFVVVGPRTNFTRDKASRKRMLSTFGRRVAKKAAKLGLSEKQAPSHYAHLAGPGRQQRFMTEAASNLDAIQQTVINRILREIETG